MVTREVGRCLASLGGVLLALALAVPGAAEVTSLLERIETARILCTLDTEGAHISRFRVADKLVAFLLRTPDSTAVVALDLNGALRFRMAAANGSRLAGYGLNLGEDGRPLTISVTVSPDLRKKVVYDVDSNRASEIEVDARLLSTPSGDYYFCTVHNHATDPSFELYDRNGRLIRGSFGPGSDWNFAFLSDTILFLVEPDSAWFINAPSGDILHSMQPLKDQPDAVPGIAVSHSDSVIVVHYRRSIILLSFAGEELWHTHHEDNLMDVMLDEARSLLALRFQIPATKTVYFEILPLWDPGAAVKSEMFSELPTYPEPVGYSLSWFVDGLIAIWGPAGTNLFDLKEAGDYRTTFVEYDAENRSFGEWATVPGLYRPIPNTPQKGTYLRVSNDGTASLIVIPPRQ